MIMFLDKFTQKVVTEGYFMSVNQGRLSTKKPHHRRSTVLGYIGRRKLQFARKPRFSTFSYHFQPSTTLAIPGSVSRICPIGFFKKKKWLALGGAATQHASTY